jgi:phage gp46-like protein
MAMGDIALIWDPATGSMDLAIDEDADDVTTDEGLRTAVLLSLFTDRRAEDGDPLPDGGDDRRGWWADALNADGDRMGMRLWLRDRGKALPDVASDVQRDAPEALRWLVEDGVAQSVDVSADVRGGILLITVNITRPGRDVVTFRFDYVWNAEVSRAV